MLHDLMKNSDNKSSWETIHRIYSFCHIKINLAKVKLAKVSPVLNSCIPMLTYQQCYGQEEHILEGNNQKGEKKGCNFGRGKT